MAVGRDPNGKTWFFVTDLPAGPDGKRRQMRRRGFPSEKLARAEQRAVQARFGAVDLSADGTVAAELERWLHERELDLSVTGLATYRDYICAYINPHLGNRQIFSLDKKAVHDFYLKLLKSGSRRGGPLAPSTVRTVHRILQKAFRDLGIEISGIRQPRKPRRLDRGRKGSVDGRGDDGVPARRGRRPALCRLGPGGSLWHAPGRTGRLTVGEGRLPTRADPGGLAAHHGDGPG
jgi:hypothetical protein